MTNDQIEREPPPQPASDPEGPPSLAFRRAEALLDIYRSHIDFLYRR
jgi:hypothetical protein